MLFVNILSHFDAIFLNRYRLENLCYKKQISIAP